MTKVIVFSDLHAHKFQDFSEIDNETGNSRLTCIIKCLDDIKDYALENNIKLILFGGDLFHKRGAVDTVTFNLVFNSICKMTEKGLTVVLLKGNHDAYSNQLETEHSLEPFKKIDNVIVLDRFTPVDIFDIKIYPAPYSKEVKDVKDCLLNYKNIIKNNDESKKSILLFHLGISGAFVGKSSYSLADSFSVEDLHPEVYRFVVGGHFHRYQKLGGFEHAMYTGSPIMHNFNDENQEKGFVVLDMETRTSEFIEITSPKFITVTDWKNTDEQEIAGNYVRYKVNSDEVEELSKSLPEESKHRLEIQKEYKEEKRVDFDFSMSFEEIVSEYAKKFGEDKKEIGLDILREAFMR